MSATRAWDQAGSLPVPVDGRPRAEIAALKDDLPALTDLFTFMRDAELRFDTLRMRIEERSWTARSEEIGRIDVALRHPGEAKVLTTFGGDAGLGAYDAWMTDGTTVRTYVSSRKVGTRRPVRSVVRGTGDPDLPGTSRVYLAVTPLQAESIPELFIHPAGYCQNVLGTGVCIVAGTTIVAGREAIVVECDHPRTIEVAADRPDFHVRIAVDRLDGVILRLEESIGGVVTRDAFVTSYAPNAILPPNVFEFSFPEDTVFIY